MQLPAHVEWIADRMGPDLEETVRHQGSPLGARFVLAVLCEADPSPKKRAVQWLAERLIDGGFLWEDACSGVGSKAHETLVAFEAHKGALEAPQRHLAVYPTLASVWIAVAHLMPQEDGDLHEPGIRERRRLERVLARSESTILCERPGLTVAVPRTERAAKWWGRGTRWCTAADKDNAFEAYDAQGPLVVIVLNDDKLQLLIDRKNRVQFMDATDAAVTTGYVWSHWQEIGPLVMWAAKMAPNMIDFVPPSLRDRDMWLGCVAFNGRNLKIVPFDMRDREIYVAAVRQNGSMVKHVPEKLLDREISLLAVTNWGLALNEIPWRFQNGRMRLAAASEHGRIIKFIPKVWRSRKLCLAAVKNDGLALEFVPWSLRNRKMCLAAVSQHGASIEYVPRRLRDRKMYLLAVERYGWMFSIVPPSMVDHEMCMAAVRGCNEGLDLIPEIMWNQEICLASVTTHPVSLRKIPSLLRNREVCLAAVRKKGYCLEIVPPPMKDREMCLAAVTGDGSTLCYVPDFLRDVDLCVIAVRSKRTAIRWVPESIRSMVLILVDCGKGNVESKWSEEVAYPGLREALETGETTAPPGAHVPELQRLKAWNICRSWVIRHVGAWNRG